MFLDSFNDKELCVDVWKCELVFGVVGVFDLVVVLVLFVVMVVDFDSDLYLFNVVNGMLDLYMFKLWFYVFVDCIIKICCGVY